MLRLFFHDHRYCPRRDECGAAGYPSRSRRRAVAGSSGRHQHLRHRLPAAHDSASQRRQGSGVRGQEQPLADPRPPTPDPSLLPVKSIPPHFSPVMAATAEDVNRVFGDEERDARYFHVGTPLDMEETPVCLDLDRFVERSNGIFGKSGTGKTFLTRIALCGIIRGDRAVNLVFDMHSEYGWQGTSESVRRPQVRGLRQYFGNRVSVFTLDPESSRRRGAKTDFHVRI